MVMWRRICSERNILICLYLTIFLLPLSSWLFYFALVPAALLSMGDIFLTKRKVNYGGKWGWFGGGFLICSFLSVFNAPDKFFSFLTGAFCPWRMRFFMCLSLHTLRERRERGKRFMSFWRVPSALSSGDLYSMPMRDAWRET